MKITKIERLPSFNKGIKKLAKKYRTIEDDLQNFLSTAIPGWDSNYSHGIVRISKVGFQFPPIYKARHFACRSMPGKGKRTGMRIIFAIFHEQEKLVLLEIYNKSKQENHDVKIIKEFHKTLELEP